MVANDRNVRRGESSGATWAIRLGLLAIASWLIVVAGSAIFVTIREWLRLNEAAQPFPEQQETLRFVVVIAALLVVPTGIARAFRPHLALPVLAIVGLLLALGFALGATAFVDLLFLLWMFLAWVETGDLALVALRAAPASKAERLVLGAGIGAGVWGLYGLALGLLGFLNAATIVAPMVALLATMALRHRRALEGWRDLPGRIASGPRAPGWFEMLLWCSLAFSLLIGFVMALAPELMSDAYRVHLALARTYAESGRVAVIANQAQSYQPIHGQILFTIGTILHGQILAKLVHTLTGVLAVIGVGLLARRGGNRGAGVLSAALFAATPVVIWEAGTAYTDAFVVLYAVLALLALLQWQAVGGAGRALLLGGLLGFGLAAKLSFLFVIVATGLIVLALGRRGGSLLERVGAGCLIALGMGATSGGWLLRTYLLTGAIPGLSLIDAVLGINSGRGDTAEVLANLPGFGIGRSLRSLVTLPYEISAHSALFGENTNGYLGFAFLLLLPLVVVALVRPNRAILSLVIVTLVTYLAWFYSAQYIRYLLPTLGFLAALIGIGFSRLGALIALGARSSRRPLVGGVRAGACVVIATSVVFYLTAILIYPTTLPTRLVLHQQTPQAYLQSRIAMYDALQRLDGLVMPGTPVAVVPDGWQLYTHAQLLNAFNGAPELIWAPTTEATVKSLQQQHIAYIVFYSALIPPTWQGFPLMQPGALLPYADIVYSARGVTLYHLRTPGEVAAHGGAELLQNPGFEQGEGLPADWLPIGKPEYSVDGSHAHAGQRGVLATTQTGLNQPVNVEPSKPYILSYYARADQGACQARLQVNWLDANRTFVTTTIDVVNVGAEWGPQTMWMTTPPNATVGLVYVSTHLDSRCWFDDFSFRPAP